MDQFERCSGTESDGKGNGRRCTADPRKYVESYMHSFCLGTRTDAVCAFHFEHGCEPRMVANAGYGAPCDEPTLTEAM